MHGIQPVSFSSAHPHTGIARSRIPGLPSAQVRDSISFKGRLSDGERQKMLLKIFKDLQIKLKTGQINILSPFGGNRVRLEIDGQEWQYRRFDLGDNQFFYELEGRAVIPELSFSKEGIIDPTGERELEVCLRASAGSAERETKDLCRDRGGGVYLGTIPETGGQAATEANRFFQMLHDFINPKPREARFRF